MPEEVREVAARGALAHRTGGLPLRPRQRLPAGLSLPRAYEVVDLDEMSAALWLDLVDAVPLTWEASRSARAAQELDALPVAKAHGDACTRDLLVPRGAPDLVLVHFGFWSTAPLGFDVRSCCWARCRPATGPRPSSPALPQTGLPAYVDGRRAEGSPVPLEQVGRASALLILLCFGLSALPLELLDAPATPDRVRLSRERAAAARVVLDLVDATARAR